MRDLFTTNINSPCLNCEDRKMCCHDFCILFSDYKNEIKKQREYLSMIGKRNVSVYAGRKVWNG